MSLSLENKVIVITGASSGLGEASARLLAQKGAKLVLGARRLDRLYSIADDLGIGHQSVMSTDVSNYEEVKGLVDHAINLHGHIDVMVNNAGLMPQSPIERQKIQDWIV